jgi:hypothetical protein
MPFYAAFAESRLINRYLFLQNYPRFSDFRKIVNSHTVDWSQLFSQVTALTLLVESRKGRKLIYLELEAGV